jgi:hypothetical protein
MGNLLQQVQSLQSQYDRGEITTDQWLERLSDLDVHYKDEVSLVYVACLDATCAKLMEGT